MSSDSQKLTREEFEHVSIESLQFSEDCLYLDVFTPLNTGSKPLPVMVFIPGGNFQFLDGSAPIYNSERLVNTTNVIIVFIQYRLGSYFY
jgi:para-nitrobenzyl esterase